MTLRVKPRWPLERYTGFVAEFNANITVVYVCKRSAGPAAGKRDCGQYDAAYAADQGDPHRVWPRMPAPRRSRYARRSMESTCRLGGTEWPHALEHPVMPNKAVPQSGERV
jgi:hypothetical protein